MKRFELLPDIHFNTEKIADPSAFARERNAASWLYLNGEAFGSMEGGMSYAQVQSAVSRSANVVSDPPVVLSVDLAREHVSALDDLPRPTLVTCRAGPRASAVAYMYSGLRSGADPEDVIAGAEQNGAAFCRFEDYKDWVREAIETIRREGA